MFEIVARGPEPQQTWRRKLPPGQSIRLGRAPHKGWDVLWDLRISREHADLRLHGDKVEVTLVDEARNAAVHRGVKTRRFTVEPGEEFTIGRTVFRLARQDDARQTIMEDAPADDTEVVGELDAIRQQIEATRRRREQAIADRARQNKDRLQRLRAQLDNVRHEIVQQAQAEQIRRSGPSARANPPESFPAEHLDRPTNMDKIDSQDLRRMIDNMEHPPAGVPPIFVNEAQAVTDSQQAYIEALIARMAAAEEEALKADPKGRIDSNEALKRQALSVQDQMASEALDKFQRALSGHDSKLNAIDLQALRTRVQRQAQEVSQRVSESVEITDSESVEITDSEREFRNRLKEQFKRAIRLEATDSNDLDDDDNRGTVRDMSPTE